MSVSNVYNMDCMEALKAFPDGYFELCISDPPYGINVTGRHRSQTIQVERERERAGHRLSAEAVDRSEKRKRKSTAAIETDGLLLTKMKGESKSSLSSLRFILCSMIAPHRTQIHSGS